MNILKQIAVPSAASLLISTTVFAAENGPNIEFGGRLHADTTDYDNDNFQYSEGSELRRARLFVRGDINLSLIHI